MLSLLNYDEIKLITSFYALSLFFELRELQLTDKAYKPSVCFTNACRFPEILWNKLIYKQSLSERYFQRFE